MHSTTKIHSVLRHANDEKSQQLRITKSRKKLINAIARYSTDGARSSLNKFSKESLEKLFVKIVVPRLAREKRLREQARLESESEVEVVEVWTKVPRKELEREERVKKAREERMKEELKQLEALNKYYAIVEEIKDNYLKAGMTKEEFLAAHKAMGVEAQRIYDERFGHSEES